jgi:hypothetical protein
MSPALARRIEKSVGASHGHAARYLRLLLRVGPILALAALAYGFVTTHRKTKRETEEARAKLLEAIRVESTALGPEELGFMGRVEPWLQRLSRAYEGDVVTEQLRGDKELPALLQRPSVYVRGPIGAFGSTAAIAEAASTSVKDAFVVCLLDPPGSRTERALLAKVRSSGLRAPQARRLHDVDVGVRQFQIPWAERARAAQDAKELAAINEQLARVPNDDTRRAARAELLLVAMDEPDEPGPAELDGERAHQVRIGVVDLAASRVLVRLRRHVDPSWISAPTRASYAGALDSCALAFDVHEAARVRSR